MAPAKETRTRASPWLRWVQHGAEGGGVQVPVSPPPRVTAWDEAVGSKHIFTSSICITRDDLWYRVCLLEYVTLRCRAET